MKRKIDGVSTSELIDKYSKVFNCAKYPYVLKAIGDDDNAVIQMSNRELLLVKTDLLNQKPLSSLLGIAGYKDLGYLTVCANISDLLGSGAKPVAFLLGLRVTRTMHENDFDDILLGVKECCERYDLPVVGGDTKQGEALSIYGCIIGTAKEGELFTRDGAREGDKVVISGPVGNCIASAYALLHDAEFSQNYRSFIHRSILRPSLPYETSRLIAKSKVGHGGIDISDGLGGDLLKLAKSSKKGICINAEDIPIERRVLDIADHFHMQPLEFVFSIGGDYQFVVTMTEEGYDRIHHLAKSLTIIGEVKKTDRCILRHRGKEIKLPYFSHEEFKCSSFINELKEWKKI